MKRATENIHEWERYVSPNYDPPPYIRCKHCKEPMLIDEQLSRLNATEVLTAEDARALSYALPGYEDNALWHYANILESEL